MPIKFSCRFCGSHWTTAVRPGTSFGALMDLMRRVHKNHSPDCSIRNSTKIAIRRSPVPSYLAIEK